MTQQGVHKRHRPRRRRRVVLGNPNVLPIRTKGTKEAFSLEVRRLSMMLFLQGQWHHPVAQHLRDNAAIPSTQTVYRWLGRHARMGHIRQFTRNGGRQKNALSGIELFHIAVCRAAFPAATSAEMNVYL